MCADGICGDCVDPEAVYYAEFGACLIPITCSDISTGFDCDLLGQACESDPDLPVALCTGLCAPGLVESALGCVQTAGEPCLGDYGGLYPCVDGTSCVAVTDDAGYRCLAP